MLAEYDVVELKGSLAGSLIPPGTQGTVLMAFREPSLAYEVEFIADGGRSLGTYTVEPGQIEKGGKPVVISAKAA